MFACILSFVNQPRDVAKQCLPWFMLELPMFKKTFGLLDIDSLNLG